MILCCLFIL